LAIRLGRLVIGLTRLVALAIRLRRLVIGWLLTSLWRRLVALAIRLRRLVVGLFRLVALAIGLRRLVVGWLLLRSETLPQLITRIEHSIPSCSCASPRN
jgi:hypothetical protein